MSANWTTEQNALFLRLFRHMDYRGRVLGVEPGGLPQ
jgi:hypothetical protein